MVRPRQMEVYLDRRVTWWPVECVHAHTRVPPPTHTHTEPGQESSWPIPPEGPGLWLEAAPWCTLCWSKLRHSPRQLRVAAEVAFRSSRSWSKAVRGPEPGRDSMACTRFFCCPSTWFIIYKTGEQQGSEGWTLLLLTGWPAGPWSGNGIDPGRTGTDCAGTLGTLLSCAISGETGLGQTPKAHWSKRILAC